MKRTERRMKRGSTVTVSVCPPSLLPKRARGGAGDGIGDHFCVDYYCA